MCQTLYSLWDCVDLSILIKYETNTSHALIVLFNNRFTESVGLDLEPQHDLSAHCLFEDVVNVTVQQPLAFPENVPGIYGFKNRTKTCESVLSKLENE